MNFTTNPSINGAGVLIVEMYNNVPCYTVFQTRNGLYEEPGGSRDPNEDIRVTASRECREETANLLKLNPQELNDSVIVRHYIAYIIYVSGLHRDDFLNNVKITHAHCSRHWKETFNMTRIPIQNINIGTFPNAITYDGQHIKLRDRLCSVITEASKNILHILNKQPIRLNRQITQSSRNHCLINTVTYTIGTGNIGMHHHVPTQAHHSHHHSLNGKNIGLYIAPDSQFSKYPNLVKCNKSFGGLHITILGFSHHHPIQFINQLNIVQKHWTPNQNSISLANKKIFLESKTLDNIASRLHNLNFKKIKGPVHSGNPWHITINCPDVTSILRLLLVSTWSLYVVINDKNKYKWQHLLSL